MSPRKAKGALLRVHSGEFADVIYHLASTIVNNIQQDWYRVCSEVFHGYAKPTLADIDSWDKPVLYVTTYPMDFTWPRGVQNRVYCVMQKFLRHLFMAYNLSHTA